MSCNNLIVSTGVPNTTIAPAGEIHGHVESALPTQIVYGNTGAYGPDARMYVYSGSTLVGILTVQQNFCFLEAGTITWSATSGNIQCDVTEGSFASGTGGKINIVSV
jgi:hypothetical protein